MANPREVPKVTNEELTSLFRLAVMLAVVVAAAIVFVVALAVEDVGVGLAAGVTASMTLALAMPNGSVGEKVTRNGVSILGASAPVVAALFVPILWPVVIGGAIAASTVGLTSVMPYLPPFREQNPGRG
ncbi:MAG: hypothetical protein IIC91_01310 [Chloroflexi bacterium]|nr:hypothetical protein [Chloroflexota bacterium]